MLPRMVTGVRPTGSVHLGNYLGAIKSAVAMQDGHEGLFFIADLHAISDCLDPKRLREETRMVAALYLACGLDPARCSIFVQSQVPEHAQLARLLGSVCSFANLAGMIQFKEKSARGQEVSLGLFDYPVLMAADILLYQADRVPVGEDQRQHLELTQQLGHRFNRVFETEVFRIPRAHVVESGARVMSLTDGTKKMSKSDPAEGSRINLLDRPDAVTKKIKRAKSDGQLGLTFDESRPESTNLLTIYQLLSGKTREVVAQECAGMGFGVFKTMLAEVVVEYLRPIQARYDELMRDGESLNKVLAAGREKARTIAADTLSRAMNAMGFLT